VGDHGLHASELHRVQRLVHGGRNRKLVEFNKQEIALIDAILPGILSQGFEILRVEVKIAAGGDFQPLAGTLFAAHREAGARGQNRKKYLLLECGVATTCVIPSAIADSAIVVASSMVAGPSSRARQNVAVQITPLDQTPP